MIAEVYLWGTRIGAVKQDTVTDIPVFNYDVNFLESKIEVSPIVMPLSRELYSFPALSEQTFHGLPGMLADSLPDKFGNKVLEKYLSDQGRDFNSISAVERLLYTGSRGMGALEFRPEKNYVTAKNTSIDINALVKVASDILSERTATHYSADEVTMEQIINIGTSAGGARAKAVIAWNKKTNDIRSGQISAGEGYEYYLIKFDGVENNKDKEKEADDKAYTRIEYAYYLMATAAKIKMEKCSLLNRDNNYHFMTKRFDRGDNGEKVHMQTLGAIAHFDYNMPRAHSYEQAVQVMQKLRLKQSEVEQFYRRMVFNILAQNRDDHVKNISFLMDKYGTWRLSPAYDITYAYNPTNKWLSQHQMTMNGKGDNFTLADFYEAGLNMNLSKAKIKAILNDVLEAIDGWEEFAVQAKIPEEKMLFIKKKLFLAREAISI